ncbi:MAG: enoyl-CoA hydratase-related protein [Myxococcota bacterium]
MPVLAAVNGFALGGGCELALACDVIYASSQAKFGQPEVKLGLIPGFGGAVRLPRKVGLAAASEWIYTGEIYSAEQAHAIGLVHQVLEPDALLPHVRKIAQSIAARGPLAVRAAKSVLQQGSKMGWEDAAELEREKFASMFNTEDMREGTGAFLEKRSAHFKGK